MSNVHGHRRPNIHKGKLAFPTHNILLIKNHACESQFTSGQFIPRTSESYNYHCALLDSPLYKENSTTYGINYCSPLNELRNFHVVDQLPQDIMHIMMEGVIPYEMLLMLSSFIRVEKYFTLELLNDRISCFSYSTHEAKDKPTPIKSQALASSGGSLSQTCKFQLTHTAQSSTIHYTDEYSNTDVGSVHQFTSDDW